MPRIQNFSVPQGDTTVVNFDVDPDEGVNLSGATIIWRVYNQRNGLKYGDPIISKATDGDGIEITDPDLLKFAVLLNRDDTIDLLRNYFHEAKIYDSQKDGVTVTVGLMTVTETANRDTIMGRHNDEDVISAPVVTQT